MKTQGIGSASRERFGVLGLAALIVTMVGVYLALRSSAIDGAGSGTLLPYQTLVRNLVSSDQATFGDLQKNLIEIEAARARTGHWPEAGGLQGPAPSSSYRWIGSREGLFLNYLAIPSDDVSAAAWLLVIQEPDPAAVPDPAQNDEEHHRLPDGTVLHVSIWMHRFGEQVSREFVRQPQTAGWVQVLMAPRNPIAQTRK
jgi:hypothetical protein